MHYDTGADERVPQPAAEEPRKATLIERLHGRECAHRAKGNIYDADLMAEARAALEARR